MSREHRLSLSDCEPETQDMCIYSKGIGPTVRTGSKSTSEKNSVEEKNDYQQRERESSEHGKRMCEPCELSMALSLFMIEGPNNDDGDEKANHFRK